MAAEKQENTSLHESKGQQGQETIPPLWVSYAKLTRIHKFPAGAILMFWPSSWGVVLAAYSVKLPPASLCMQLILYFVSSTLRHNAACIWNDMCDRDFDKKVERTKGRPLARGLISMTGAAIFLIVHLILCAILLLYANNDMALKVGLFGLLFVDTLYPLMKRWTNWPQAWLGFTMTWGLPVSWIAIKGDMDWTLIPVLFFGGMCWTMHYDTIYACQDRKDDVKAGVRSTAVLFGDNVRFILSCFSACFVLCLALVGKMNGNGPAYFIITVFGVAVHLAWQLTTLDFNIGSECWRMFQANGTTGALILSGMFCDYALNVLG